MIDLRKFEKLSYIGVADLKEMVGISDKEGWNWQKTKTVNLDSILGLAIFLTHMRRFRILPRVCKGEIGNVKLVWETIKIEFWKGVIEVEKGGESKQYSYTQLPEFLENFKIGYVEI